MSGDLQKIQFQLGNICNAFSHITQVAQTILLRLDGQDKRLDYITNQLAGITANLQPVPDKDEGTGSEISETLKPSASTPTLHKVEPVTLLTNNTNEEITPSPSLVSSKSTPSLMTNDVSPEKAKKLTKKNGRRGSNSHKPLNRQRHNRHVMQKQEIKCNKGATKFSDKPANNEAKIMSKKVSCESGVFSSDDLYSEELDDEFVYETVLSEEEIVIAESSSDQQDEVDQETPFATPPSISPSQNNTASESNQQESAVENDKTQAQNSNHAEPCVVTEAQTDTAENRHCDVTEIGFEAAGANACDKSESQLVPTSVKSTGVQNNKPKGNQLSVMGHTLQEGRRASYAGLTLKQKQKILAKKTDVNKDRMTPTSLPANEPPPRPHSSCTIPRNDTMKSDVGDASCMDRRLIDVKRQFSNSSTNSAPGGIQITIGADTESEDDEDVEIKLPNIPAPAFSYRSVTVKNSTYKHFYELKEQLGGGRFGKVYRCVEKKTGLQLAAKCFLCKKPVTKTLLKSKSLKRAPQNLKTKRTQQEPVDKEDVMIEISIMNLIDNENVVKLYDAYENDNTMTLILEYLGGGELFERVLADQSQLTELDAVLFMQQIIKAVQYLHKNLILHLDLKPENILCLDRTTHHIKIIDFGLARKYIPRQKLVVQWGTPEFMAPEVLNYEVVSFPSDMWSVGVICYILLSGISPFLGENDSETMENIADCAWDFDEEPFKIVSDDAKDFISRLLVIAKSGRMSATQCLRHEWLSTPLTSRRRKALMNKTQLKVFMARMHWKASIAAVTAANWLRGKVTNSGSDSDVGSAV